MNEPLIVAPEAAVLSKNAKLFAFENTMFEALTELTAFVTRTRPELTTVGTLYEPVMVAIDPAVEKPNVNPFEVPPTRREAFTDD